jgi:hypothetical protein
VRGSRKRDAVPGTSSKVVRHNPSLILHSSRPPEYFSNFLTCLFSCHSESFRPISEFHWSDIRQMVLNAPCDLLLILDCCAAGGANLRHVDWQPSASTARFTKHLFAACGFESSTRDDMTAALCEVLDDHATKGGRAPLTTKRLHQIMEDRLQKTAVGSQPIFKQLLPRDPERHITLPMLADDGWYQTGPRGFVYDIS